MALRKALGVSIAVLAACAWMGCKGKGDKAEGSDLDARCAQLAKACADEKHGDKLVADCKQAATKQTASSCVEMVKAAYDCFEKELCGKGEPAWTLDDLGVLADRHKKCVAERDAARNCAAK
jgi:hypothetical protein